MDNPLLYMIDHKLQIQRVITDTITNPPLSWSGDGQNLLFSSSLENQYKFSIYDLDISSGFVEEVPLLIPGNVNLQDPDWAPDKKKIAFVQPGAPIPMIYIFNLENNNIDFLTTGYSPKWIKGRGELVFLKYMEGGKLIFGKDVWVGGKITQIQVDGQAETQISPDIISSKLSISPDGNRVVIQEITPNAQLWKINSQETIDLPISFNSSYEPTWTLDGKSLLYADECILKLLNVSTKISQRIEGLPEGYCYLYAAVQP